MVYHEKYPRKLAIKRSMVKTIASHYFYEYYILSDEQARMFINHKPPMVEWFIWTSQSKFVSPYVQQYWLGIHHYSPE